MHSPSFTGVCCKIKNFKPFGQIKSRKNPPTDMPEANFTNEVADFASRDSHRAECRAHKPPQFNTHRRPAQTDAGGQQGGAYSAASTRVFAAEYNSTPRTAHPRLAVRRPMRCAPVRLLVHAPPSLSSGPDRSVPCARAPSWGPPPSPLPSPHDIYPTAQRHNSANHPNRRTGRGKCVNISDKSSLQY